MHIYILLNHFCFILPDPYQLPAQISDVLQNEVLQQALSCLPGDIVARRLEHWLSFRFSAGVQDLLPGFFFI